MINRREIVPIFRIPFDNLTTEGAVERIREFVKSDTFHLMVTVNLDLLVRAMFDFEFYEIIRGADMVTADGMPIVWASSLFPGSPTLKERVTGSDLTPILAAMAACEEWPILFFGGEPEHNRKAVENLKKNHPNLKITILPCEFSPLLEIDHITVMEKIHEVKPKLLFMFLGTKGEKWATMNRHELGQAGVRMAVSVGATLKFLSGAVQRAPGWMRNFGLEWAYRLFQEPGYLWKRYVKDLTVFSLLFIRQYFRSFLLCFVQHRIPELPETSKEEILKERVMRNEITIRLILQGRLSVSNIDDLRLMVSDTLLEKNEIRILEIDLSYVRRIDSAVMDYLISLHRDLRGQARILNISRISPEVSRIFTSSRMHRYLTMKYKIEIGELKEKFGNIPIPKSRAFTFYGIVKRVMDFVGSLFGLSFLFVPAFLAAGIAIKLEDGGPIFFKQVRVGRDGIPFYLWKFRSMRIDAEAMKKDLAGKAEVSGKIFKMKNDPRITRVGRFIRKASIDEFPQFWAVLTGFMSLVGPRPAVNYEVKGYDPGDHERMRNVKPGITGLAQVYERHYGKLDFGKQLKLDLKYIRRRGLWLDITLLFKTIPAVLFPKGAC